MHFTLSQLGLINSPPEEEYDNLTSLAAQMLDVPVVHISILDRKNERVVYKSQYGHPDELAAARELPMELTYCQHVALTQKPVIVVNANEDPLLKGTPALQDGPLAYLGLPIYAPNGQVIGGLCLMQPDVREWSETEIANVEKLAACVTDLIKLKAAMLTSEGLRKEQREFTYAISHDLKSPTYTLEMILGEVDIEKDCLSDDVQLLVSEGLGTIKRMKQQVEDVLGYSRVFDVECATEMVSLEPLINDVLLALKSDIENTNAKINCGTLPDVVGNEHQLKAMFLCLIDNALKFHASGRDPEVTITGSLKDASGDPYIMIRDNGIGIHTDDQLKVFNLFTRLHLREHYAGTGIGLTLCHRVADNHNGSISIKSDGLNGSTFSVTLPRHQL